MVRKVLGKYPLVRVAGSIPVTSAYELENKEKKKK